MTVCSRPSEQWDMRRRPLIHEKLTRSVIGAFYEVYNTLGFGFSEHLYMVALEYELRERGHEVRREIPVNVYYKGLRLGRQRIDMVVDATLVVEGKAGFDLRLGVRDQLYSYLHATEMEVGLLLHFGPKPKFYRVVSMNTVSYPANPAYPSDPEI